MSGRRNYNRLLVELDKAKIPDVVNFLDKNAPDYIIECYAAIFQVLKQDRDRRFMISPNPLSTGRLRHPIKPGK